MAYLATAIDMGSWSLKAVIARVGVKSVQVTDIREIKYAADDDGKVAPEEIARALEECFGSGPKPEAVYTALSGRDFFFRILSLPRAGMKRLDQIARLQIEDDVPVEIEEYIVDAVPLRDAGDGKLVDCIVAAARTEHLRGIIERLSAIGLDPAEITCGPYIYSYATRLSSEPSVFEPLAILDLGHSSSELVIIEGGRSVSYRSILWGGKNITDAIRQEYNITFSHAENIKEEYGMLRAETVTAPGSMEEKIITLCRESVDPLVVTLRQTLMGYLAKTGKMPQKLFLCGGTARLRGMAPHLQGALSVDTQTAGDDDPQETRLVRARALMGETSRTESRHINFRKDALTYEGKMHVVRRRWIRAVAFVAVVIIGWFLYSMAQISSLEKVMDKQHTDLAQITKEISGEEVDDFSKAELMLKKSAASKNPVPKQDVYDILDTMSRKFPDTVVHDVEELDIRSDRWRIRGIVDTISDRDKIYEALIGYKDCIKSISKGKTTLSVKDNRQKYNFDMEVSCP
jgi:Tfp pilus assembly PilM family ATPase